MMAIGIDAHKHSHSAVMVDGNGRERSTKTVGTTTQDHLRLLKWAAAHDDARLWAIEDCRHLTRRLERDLIAAGESVVRVPPKLMAHIRDSARTFGKSDHIDALAVARAALREPDLRWLVSTESSGNCGCWQILTAEVDALAAEITARVTIIAPSLLAIVGCGPLTAAKIVGQTAQVSRFRSKDTFRPIQRNSTTTGVVLEQAATSTLAHRKPPAQRCIASHRDDTGENAPTRT